MPVQDISISLTKRKPFSVSGVSTFTSRHHVFQACVRCTPVFNHAHQSLYRGREKWKKWTSHEDSGIPGSLRPGSEVSRCGPQPRGISNPTLKHLSGFEIAPKRMCDEEIPAGLMSEERRSRSFPSYTAHQIPASLRLIELFVWLLPQLATLQAKQC